MPDAPYRAPLPIPPDPYLVAWARLRRRRRVLAAALAAMGLSWPLLGWVAAHWTRPASDMFSHRAAARRCEAPVEVHGAPEWIQVAIPITVIAELAGMVVLGITLGLFRCPHCGRRFAESEPRRRANRCVHCGIAIGTPRAAFGAPPPPPAP